MATKKNEVVTCLFSVLLALTLVLSLAACGGNNPPSGTNPPPSGTGTPETSEAFTTYEVGGGFSIEVPNDKGLQVTDERNDPESESIEIVKEGAWSFVIIDQHRVTDGYDRQRDTVERIVSKTEGGHFESVSFGAHSGHMNYNDKEDALYINFPYGNATRENEPFGIIGIRKIDWKEGDDVTQLLSDPVIQVMLESITLK